MKEIILDYMCNSYNIKGGLEVHTYDGKRVYYDDIVRTIGTVFQLDDSNCEVIMLDFFCSSSLDYGHFKEIKKRFISNGRMYDSQIYNDYYDRYVCGVDFGNPDGDVTAINILHHPVASVQEILIDIKISPTTTTP